MDDNANDFLKRLSGFSMGPLISAIIGFITVPVTTYLVSPEDFGKSAMYTMGYTISSLFIFLGLDQAYGREYNAYKDKSELFWNSLIVPLIFSILMGGMYIIFYKPISLIMFNSVERYIVIILAVSLPFSVIDRFNMLILRMEEKARQYSLFNIINKLLTLVVLIPYLLFIDKSYKGIINATFISLIVVCLIESYYVKHVWKNKFKINKSLLIKMFRFGFPLIPASIIGWFFSSMDRIALRQWSNFSEIGIYSAAFKIVGILAIIQSCFSAFWVPTAYRWHDNNVSNDKYIKVSEILLTIMCLLFSFIVLFKDLIIYLLSSNYVTASKSVPFLLFFPIMYTVSETTTLGIPFSRKTYYNIIISVVSATVNYIGNYLLVPKFGSMGASISTGVSYIVFFFIRTLISRKLWFDFSIKVYVKNIVLLLILSFTSITINSFIINLLIVISIIYINRNSIYEIIKIIKPILKNKYKSMFRSLNNGN
ncbi:oligosaccharide flippase family protein [Clostridium botulinum]|uniref:oligosaccharide flippase family protein n=1 Tax=Clostridium sporogenes TaxID=1509 RepID=UPI002237F362|nr:oligosaccharide flippase family protein [Clostridium sporogenes]MCW6110423.1 oligosaccharide flippase family protein [Clostridium sporogenes]